VAHNRCIDELRRPALPPPELIELVSAPIHDPTAEAEQRESLRRVLADVQRLPQQQRSALLMRELAGMTYTDISAALEVSIPAVKSLLVRARVGLAQASLARDTACSQIREELILAHDRGVRPGATARRHMHDCAACRDFRLEIRGVSGQLAALVPGLGASALLAKLGLGGFGSGFGGFGGGAGGGAAASGTIAAAGTAAGGGTIASAGVLAGGHVATLLAAAVVTAGSAVELQHSVIAPHHRPHAQAQPSAGGASSRPFAAPAAITEQPAVAPQVVIRPLSAQPSATPPAAAKPSAVVQRATRSPASADASTPLSPAAASSGDLSALTGAADAATGSSSSAPAAPLAAGTDPSAAGATTGQDSAAPAAGSAPSPGSAAGSAPPGEANGPGTVSASGASNATGAASTSMPGQTTPGSGSPSSSS
jgi:hypothetical protein